MKTEFIDVSDTKKNLVVEIPTPVVEAEIEKITRNYGRSARISGFRPGKVPAKVVRKRFRDQILHDVAHGLIPRAVDDALRERGVEPVDTPDIRDVVVEEGQPLTFTASFDTVPPIDPGDYATITLRRKAMQVENSSVDEALARLQSRSARYEPVEGRAIQAGDSVVLDMDRTALTAALDATDAGDEAQGEQARVEGGEAQGEAAQTAQPKTDHHHDVTVDIGGAANPPGFDDALIGLQAGESKSFDIDYPADYQIAELAGTKVRYQVQVKAIRTRVLPELDDEFAKDLGQFESLEGLRSRVREDLEQELRTETDREARGELLRQLAAKVTFEVPASLVDREVQRRVEEFVRRLIEQQVDPTKANINWTEFRERQRDAATEAVKSTLVLDEVARREQLTVSDEEAEAELNRFAEYSGRTLAAVRAQVEKEGSLARLYTGLRREKAVSFLLGKVTTIQEG
jgi:trigger factor